MTSPIDPSIVLPPEVVKRLLVRAAALDSRMSGGLTLHEIRNVAAEAGIQASALEAALKELGEDFSLHDHEHRASVPWWVRLCMFSVPDRVAAMRFYWIFVAMILVSPLYLLLVPTAAAPSVGLLLFGIFASWATSRAVQWLDRHGWELLRRQKHDGAT